MERYKRVMFYTAAGNSEKNLYKDEVGKVWVKVNGVWERAVETFIYIVRIWTLKKEPILKLVCQQDMMRAKLSGVADEKIYQFVEESVKEYETCWLGRLYRRLTKEEFREALVQTMNTINVDIIKKGITNDWIQDYDKYLQ